MPTDAQIVNQKRTEVLAKAAKKGLKVLSPDSSRGFVEPLLGHDARDFLGGLLWQGSGTFKTVHALDEIDVCKLGGMSDDDKWLDRVADSLDPKAERVFAVPKRTKGAFPTLVFWFE
jgi:hypothetical protein